jgi:tellurite resistance protein TerC
MVWLWAGFIVFVMALLILDLGVVNRGEHEINTRSALLMTGFFVLVALSFNVVVYFLYANHIAGLGLVAGHQIGGRQAALEYITGYLIEYSLSVDNIFVIALIFTYFKVPLKHQHRTLFWGILGALFMRGVMIATGTALIRKFEWMIYVFGALLILTAIKLLLDKGGDIDPDKNPLVRMARKFFPVTQDFHGEKFFAKMHGKRAITPLFLVLLVIESMDVLFAVDSIPAIFAVTLDPFIVFTSNVFAILGLRSLYFALAAAIGMFRYLKYSLVFVLAFVGVKMLISHYVRIHTGISLGVITAILAVGVIASLLRPEKKQISDN